MKINKKLLMLTQLSILVALEIVMSRLLSFSVWNQKIGFAFVAVAAAGMLYGPIGGAIVGGLSDFLGAILFPIGAYFPGFTLTNAILGVIFGLFLNTKKIEVKHKGFSLAVIRSILAAVINQIVCTLLLNSIWISVLYKTPIRELMATRLVQAAIMLPVQIIILPILYKLSVKLKSAIKVK